MDLPKQCEGLREMREMAREHLKAEQVGLKVNAENLEQMKLLEGAPCALFHKVK